ncbi:MAG: hypothetical protein ACKO7D_02835 [Bacteroidota bacterium]
MKAYFFVITPLNYLYALQASLDDRFAFEEKHLIVLSDFNRSLRQFKSIIDEKSWSSVKYPMIGTNKSSKSRIRSYLFAIYNKMSFIRLYKKITISNSTIFWGNYNHKYSKYLKEEKNSVFFLDDGFSTINIVKNLEKEANDLNDKNNRKFYTIFNLYSQKNTIVRHEFEHLFTNKHQSILTNSIYFLGQPLVFNNVISEEQYVDSVNKIFEYYSKQGKNCFYISHRSTNKNYIPKNWNVIDFNLPIEFIQLVENTKTLNYFMTFYSTGVFNLKQLYKLNNDQCIFWELPSEWLKENYRKDIESVYEYLKINHFNVKKMMDINPETNA